MEKRLNIFWANIGITLDAYQEKICRTVTGIMLMTFGLFIYLILKALLIWVWRAYIASGYPHFLLCMVWAGAITIGCGLMFYGEKRPRGPQ